MPLLGIEPRTSRFRVRRSTTTSPRSLPGVWLFHSDMTERVLIGRLASTKTEETLYNLSKTLFQLDRKASDQPHRVKTDVYTKRPMVLLLNI